MKIWQDTPKFKPINIVLETATEANDFIALIDKVDATQQANRGWMPARLTESQKKLLIAISDTFTERIGLRGK